MYTAYTSFTMITFIWSFITAFGFTASGVLLREGEFRLSGILFAMSWVWLVFPKIPTWIIRRLGRMFTGSGTAERVKG